jgi:hypothetical protein
MIYCDQDIGLGCTIRDGCLNVLHSGRSFKLPVGIEMISLGQKTLESPLTATTCWKVQEIHTRLTHINQYALMNGRSLILSLLNQVYCKNIEVLMVRGQPCSLEPPWLRVDDDRSSSRVSFIQLCTDHKTAQSMLVFLISSLVMYAIRPSIDDHHPVARAKRLL